MQHVLQIINKH